MMGGSRGGGFLEGGISLEMFNGNLIVLSKITVGSLRDSWITNHLNL